MKIAIGLLLVARIIGGGEIVVTYAAAQEERSATQHVEPAGAGAIKGDPLVDPLPAGSALRFGSSRFRHGIPVSTLAISPDGKMAFVANDNHMEGMSRAFDLATGRVLYSFEQIRGVEVGAFSPDGRTLVTKEGSNLIVRDAVTGKVLRTLEGSRTNPWSRREWLEFTPDGNAIAVASEGDHQARAPQLHLIDFESGKTIREFSVHNPESELGAGFSGVLGIAFSPDGKLMASGGYDNDKGSYFTRLWEVETGKELRRFIHGNRGYGIKSLAFSPDGKTLATLGENRGANLQLFDVDTGAEQKSFPKDGDQRTERGSVAFSPDGKLVAAACGSIRLYDTKSGEERLRIDGRASDLHFTDGGKTLTGAVSGAIYRWDTSTGKSLIPDGGDSVVEQILITPDGSRLVTRSQNGDAHLWDGANGQHLRRIQAARQRGLAMSPSGEYLVWPVDDKSIQFTNPQIPKARFDGSRIHLYDIAADRLVDRFPSYKGDTQDLAFTHDGKKLVTVDQHAGMVRVWNFEVGKEERSFDIMPESLKQQSFSVWRARLSADGKVAVVTYEKITGQLGLAGPPQVVRFWDVATGNEGVQLNNIRPLDKAFSPDGQLIVTGSGGSAHVVFAVKKFAHIGMGQLSITDVASGQPVATLAASTQPVTAAFAPDGRTLATSARDGVIRLWDTKTWTVRAEFHGHRDRVTALAFGPDGQLFSGGLDTVVLKWDVQAPSEKEGK